MVKDEQEWRQSIQDATDQAWTESPLAQTLRDGGWLVTKTRALTPLDVLMGRDPETLLYPGQNGDTE